MFDAFISHSSEDKYFVDLLVKILKFHKIETWYDSSDIGIGEKQIEKINNGLAESECLIVVLSKNSIRSKWIVREIAFFQASKKNATKVPILLDSLKMDEVYDGLAQFQAVQMFKNMLSGFKQLLSYFEKEFLKHNEKRKGNNRRTTNDQRDSKDRRNTAIIVRLRKGFWKTYTEATGLAKFDDFDLSTMNRMKVMKILKPEIEKFSFHNEKGVLCEISNKELDRITYGVWEQMMLSDHVTAIVTIESIAEEFEIKYTVSAIDGRRDQSRRSTQIRRLD